MQYMSQYQTVSTRFALGLVLLLSLVLKPALAASPLPRIEIKNSQFQNSISGSRFEPRGFNYARLDGVSGSHRHSTFEPRQYDSVAVEAMFTKLESVGFNHNRVLVDQTVGPGCVAKRKDTFLSPAYMANVVDYLQRARNHGVYTSFQFPFLVASRKYNRIIVSTPDVFLGPIENVNLLYLNAGHVAAKAQWIADFASSIQQFDPSLTSGILAYQIQGEAAFVDSYPPFSLSSGRITGPGGTVYDLSTDAGHAALADAATIYWANTTRQIVQAVDRDALVTVGIFTNLIVGRSDFGQPSSYDDPRFPHNPLALLDSDLDFIGFALYPRSNYSLQQNLDSIGWDLVKAKAERLGTLATMNEFGCLKINQRTIANAISNLTEHLDAVESKGFEGYMLWTYDTNEQSKIWNSQESDGAIFDMLAARNPPLDKDFGGGNDADYK